MFVADFREVSLDAMHVLNNLTVRIRSRLVFCRPGSPLQATRFTGAAVRRPSQLVVTMMMIVVVVVAMVIMILSACVCVQGISFVDIMQFYLGPPGTGAPVHWHEVRVIYFVHALTFTRWAGIAASDLSTRVRSPGKLAPLGWVVVVVVMLISKPFPFAGRRELARVWRENVASSASHIVSGRVSDVARDNETAARCLFRCTLVLIVESVAVTGTPTSPF